MRLVVFVAPLLLVALFVAPLARPAFAEAAPNSSTPSPAPSDAPAPSTSTTPADAPIPFMVEATSMIDSRNYDAAARILETGISDLEHRTSRFDASLPAPLALLGDAYLGEGEYAKARDAYGRALHIERTSAGLRSPTQVEYVYKEARSLAVQGDYDRATGREEYAYDLLRQTYGQTSIKLVPGMFALAEWYESEPLPNVFAARDLYQQALDNQERAYGVDSPKLVPTLQRLAQTYKNERFPAQLSDTTGETHMVTPTFDPYMQPIMRAEPSFNQFGDGERDLQRAVILTKKDPDSAKLDLALAELELADWYLLFDKWDRAQTLYTDVRRIMKDEAGLTDVEIQRYFGAPDATACVGCVLWLPLPSAPAVSPKLKGGIATGHVELSYTVTDRGAVDDLTTVSSEPEGKMDTKVRRAFRSARFRPRFEGDVAVATKGIKYVYQFPYVAQPEPPPAAASTAQGS
jgi:tetratricopeptide (TPR) repeat protein